MDPVAERAQGQDAALSVLRRTHSHDPGNGQLQIAGQSHIA